MNVQRPATSDDATALYIREQIARIDRAMAETEKLRIETDKSMAEAHKFPAEARKLRVGHWFAPFLAVGTFFVALAGLVTNILVLIRLTGHG